MTKSYRTIIKAILLPIIILPLYVHTGCDIIDIDNANVWDGDYEIQNQEDLLFLSDYKHVTGNLKIYSDSLTDLSGLENLISVGGSFCIGCEFPGHREDVYIARGNSELTSLNGLENLFHIGGGLSIMYNPVLASLNGLGNLFCVKGGLTINRNDSLTSLKGLENITYVGRDLYIYDNDCLSDEIVNDFYEQLLSYGFDGGSTIENNGSLYPCP
jgi:hypothetical protein